ncbi:MAG: zinc-ribbon domain-containing protein [Gemmataceae bacterium]|nr:zinc-ribbon domain-containing protein [Gemmataceae bacterium]
MRVQCPHCQKTVTLDNSQAEKPSPCPSCGNIFTAPALLQAMPDIPEPVPAPAPPPRVEPVTLPAPPTPTAATPPRPAGSAEPWWTITLSRRVLHWFGPIGLMLLFLLTFFVWVAASPGGIPVYTQSAWGVMTGGFAADITGEEVFGLEKKLYEVKSFSFSMFLFLMILIPVVIVGVGELFQQYITVPIPDIINALWPKRLMVLTAASWILFALLGLQMMGSMGLEATAAVQAEVKLAAPAEETPKQKLVRELKRGEEVSRLGVRRTGWLWLAFLATTTAAIGFSIELWLEKSGKPDPVIEVRC